VLKISKATKIVELIMKVNAVLKVRIKAIFPARLRFLKLNE
jgi:hypothetical protein